MDTLVTHSGTNAPDKDAKRQTRYLRVKLSESIEEILERFDTRNRTERDTLLQAIIYEGARKYAEQGTTMIGAVKIRVKPCQNVERSVNECAQSGNDSAQTSNNSSQTSQNVERSVQNEDGVYRNKEGKVVLRRVTPPVSPT